MPVTCIPPRDPADTTGATDTTSTDAESGGQVPWSRESSEAAYPSRPQPALMEQLVSPWMQCFIVFKKRFLLMFLTFCNILDFLLEQFRRGAYRKHSLSPQSPTAKHLKLNEAALAQQISTKRTKQA